MCLEKNQIWLRWFGVKILKGENDFLDLPDCEMIIEDLVVFKELSVIVAMNEDGKLKTYEAVEMEFNPNSNQVEFVIESG